MDAENIVAEVHEEHGYVEESGSSGGPKKERYDKIPPDIENQNDGFPRSMIEANKNAFKLKLISLLMQMTSPTVRGDFISGVFGPTMNPDILSSIDQIRWSVIPRWQTDGRCSTKYIEASEHLDRLLNRSNALFCLDPENATKQSYSQWMSVLELLAGNEYWSSVPSNDRCTHNFDDAKIESVHMKESKINMPTLKIEKTSTKMIENTKLKTKANDGKPVKIEEIILSSSDPPSSSDSNTETSNSSRSSSNSRDRRRRRRNKKKASGRYYTKEKDVVTPPVYEINSKTPLKEFMDIFEAYFKNKYCGNEYDKSQLLGQFLKDELLQVYDARGGRRMKFGLMKEELLSYYKKLKVGRRSHWRKQLAEMVPEMDEPYDIFGMKLAEIAQLAYPDDKREGASQLRIKFLSKLPAYILAEIKSTERSNKATTRGKSKYLPFSAITELARELQVSQPKQASVMWTTSLPEKNEVNERIFKPTNRNNANRETVSPRKPSQHRNNGQDSNCTYCKKDGHTRKDCWREGNLCLICGQGHHIEKCPKYNPNRSRQRTQIRNPEPLN